MKKISIIIFLFCSLFAKAQQLTVAVDKNPAIAGEQILVQYTINTKGNGFKAPKFNGLRVLSGPNPSTQSSYSYVNGKSQNTSSTTYTFYLKASKEGNYTISPASINVNGKTIKSKSLQLKVVKASERTKAEQKSLTENLFIKVSVSKSNIYVGEQILVSYKLFTRIDLASTVASNLPALNGFWTKDLEASSRFKREVINGVPYNTATIKKSVLTAQKSGQLIIDPLELKCSIRVKNKRNSRDPIANMFGGGYSTQDEFITSKPIHIKVKELPKPTPNNFNGAVGNISVTSSIDNNTIAANDAITYKLKLTGTGNLELIEPLTINFPSDFEVYDPKISERIFEGGRKRSIKTYEYLLIPRYKGEYTIPEATLSVFNTKTKKYQNKRASSHNIKVTKSKNNEDGNTQNQQLVSNNKDIHYISKNTNLKKINDVLLSKNLFLTLFLLPLLILLIFRAYTAINKSDKNSSKTKKANKIALKRLKSAQNCIKNNDFDLFFEEIEKSLWGYFSDKFKVNAAELSKESINMHFNKSSINKNIETAFIALLDECEFARYAPASNKNTQMDTILEKAKTIIIEVETSLK